MLTYITILIYGLGIEQTPVNLWVAYPCKVATSMITLPVQHVNVMPVTQESRSHHL